MLKLLRKRPEKNLVDMLLAQDLINQQILNLTQGNLEPGFCPLYAVFQ